MQWDTLGFKNDPFKTQPITSETLSLYTGNQKKLDNMRFNLNTSNAVIVVEGDRGVGTTSFGNFVRFQAQKEKKYFTPTAEIKIEPYWNADTLLAAVIGNIVRTLELNFLSEIKNNKQFLEAKAIVSRITETFRSFGINAFGMGGSYGESGMNSQPMIMPTQMLAHHLEDLVTVIEKLGFKHGILIQLNNLDVGVVQEEKHLKMLLNVMRDYFQLPGTTWLLVGDTELRRFIAQKVDRVDDIIKFETEITPLSETEYLSLIQKRIETFRINPQVDLPVDKDVWLYLFHITKGRLRYIFGLLSRIFSTLQLGVLTDKVTLDLAKPVIKNFAGDRIKRHKLAATDELVLKAIVKEKEPLSVGELAKKLKKSQTQISKILRVLHKHRLITYRQSWRKRLYSPTLDAELAYSD